MSDRSDDVTSLGLFNRLSITRLACFLSHVTRQRGNGWKPLQGGNASDPEKILRTKHAVTTKWPRYAHHNGDFETRSINATAAETGQ